MNGLRLSRIHHLVFLGQALTFTACDAENVVFKEETSTIEGELPGEDSIAAPGGNEEAGNSAVTDESGSGLPSEGDGALPEGVGADESYAGNDASGEDADGSSSKTGDDRTAADRLESELALAQWTFKAPEKKSVQLVYEPDQAAMAQQLVMDDNRVPANASFKQPTRPVTTRYFKQGTDIREQMEGFQQNGQGPLDILVVVDNSGSMTEEQKNLSSKLSPLLSYVQNSDWRIGFVTTDTANGCLRALISKNDTNISTKFANAVNAGVKGSGNERGILQAVRGLKGECNANGSWLRKDSALAVLILSDEDNCSDGNGCGNDPWKNGSYLLDYMNSIRQVGVNAKVYGLIGHPSLSKQQCGTIENKANIYADVIAASQGTWGSICDSNYATTLEAVSKNMGAILQSQFALKYKAEAAGAQVRVNGQLLTSGYSIQGNILKFDSIPPASAVISVAYEYNAETPKASFALPEAVDPATLKVYVDAVEDQSAQYNEADQAIVFASAPVGTDIKVTFKAPAAQGAQFNLGHAATDIALKINGVLQASQAFAFNSLTQSIELNQCPAEDAAIEVAYRKIVEPTLDYKMNIPEAARVEVKARDSGESIAAERSAQGLRFAKEDFAPGRVLDIAIYSPNPSIQIAADVDFDSIVIEGASSGVCEDWALNENGLDLSACAFASHEKVAVSYAYEQAKVTNFDLGRLPELPGQWLLTVNGKSYEAFEIEDQQLRVLHLPPEAVVELTYLASQN